MVPVTCRRTIRLWSYHEPGDYSPLSGTVDLKKSPYFNDADIMAAYAKLHRRLNTNQLVWCYTNKADFPETGIEKIEYEFAVPLTGVLRFYDTVVWSRIIGKTGVRLPRDVLGQFRTQALQKFPYDSAKRHEYESRLIDLHWREPPPTGDWWDELFVEYAEQEGVDALLRHPVDSSWYVGRQRRGLRVRH